MDSGSGDIIVKIANTQNGRDGRPVNGDDLVLWTGEKLGLLSFSSKPGFTAETFEDTGHKTAEDLRKEQQERTHSETMVCTSFYLFHSFVAVELLDPT